MSEQQPTKADDVPTLMEVQATKRQTQKVLTIDMTDVKAAPIVKFKGAWTNSDMKVIQRVLRRQFMIYRAQLRKGLAPSTEVNNNV